MKQVFFYIVLIITSLNALAQEQVKPAEEIKPRKFVMETGLNVYALNHTPPYYHVFFMHSSYISHDVANGLYFKIFKKQNGLRVAFNYDERSWASGPGYYKALTRAPGYNAGWSRSGEMKLGYQYLISRGRISPYLFSDLKYRYTHTKGVNDFYMNVDYNMPFEPSEYTYSESLGAISSGIGMRINIKDRFVFNIEHNIDQVIFSGRNKISSSDLFNDDRIHLQPFRLGMGIIF